VTGFVGREPYRGGGDILGFDERVHRLGLKEGRFVVRQRDVERPGDLRQHETFGVVVVVNRSGAQRVGPDLQRRVVERGGLGQPDQAVLGGDVPGEMAVPDQPGRGRDIHDAAGTTFGHQPADRPGHPPRAGQVDIEHQRPLLLGDFVGRLPGRGGDAGVVHQDVDRPEALVRLRHRAFHRRQVAYVRVGGEHRGAILAAQAGRMRELAGGAERIRHSRQFAGDIEEGEVGPFPREGDRAGAAEASRRARDHDRLAAEAHGMSLLT
jgi:hypothetical protein